MRSITLAFSLALVAGCSSGPGGTPGVPTYDYSLTPFPLQPQGEQISCYYVPADGKEKYATRFVTEMNPGSHHLIVMRIDETRSGGTMPAAGPAPCVDIPNGFDG